MKTIERPSTQPSEMIASMSMHKPEVHRIPMEELLRLLTSKRRVSNICWLETGTIGLLDRDSGEVFLASGRHPVSE